MARTVFIAEDEDLGRALADGVWLTGRFSASLEDEDRELESAGDLSFEEALAWGRGRAPQVIVRHGDDPFEDYPARSLEWGAEQLDTFTEDLAAAERRGARGRSSYGSLNLHAVLHLDAPTGALACAAATARLELPPGWRDTPVAEPLEDHEPGRAG